MTARIAIFGTESTGKTTLAHQLAEHFNAPWATEYVREFWDARNGDIRPQDLGTIAQGQIANEAAATQQGGPLVICDTELITNTLWADILFPGHCPDWVRKEAERRSRQYALYLLCDTDIDFAPDPQRCFPEAEDRAWARNVWRKALMERNLTFVMITGDRDDRYQAAVEAIRSSVGSIY